MSAPRTVRGASLTFVACLLVACRPPPLGFDLEIVAEDGMTYVLVVPDDTTDEQLEKMLWRFSLHATVPPIQTTKAVGLNVTVFRERDRQAAVEWNSVRGELKGDSPNGEAVAAYYSGDVTGEFGLVGGYISSPRHRVVFASGAGRADYERLLRFFREQHSRPEQ